MEKYIKNTKYILMMCFVLFSISTCVIKEALFSTINVEYAKPLNASKTTTQTTPCEYSLTGKQQISQQKLTKNNKFTNTIDFVNVHNYVVRTVKIQQNFTNTFLASVPPKYILFKRLKINLL